jgi:hypothetical protein
MKYLKYFKTHSEYQQCIEEGLVLPNVSLIVEYNSVAYHPYIPLPTNIITYCATEKLVETTSDIASGLHVNAFNCAIKSHEFVDGVGIIIFEEDLRDFSSIGYNAFRDCSGLTSITIPDSVTIIGGSAFSGCSGLTEVIIGSGVTSIGNFAFRDCSKLAKITSRAITAPTLPSTTFYNVKSGGILYVPAGSINSYSTWMQTGNDYLGKYNWTIKEMYIPTECTSLTISADDVSGDKTFTTIHYTAVTNGTDLDGNPMTGITITGTVISSEFPQNSSETETVERTITFEYLGATASTVITQGVYLNLINFTVTDIEGTKYFQSEPDMTWQEWVNSEYNNQELTFKKSFFTLTDYLTIVNDTRVGISTSTIVAKLRDTLSTDTIIDGKNYTFV